MSDDEAPRRRKKSKFSDAPGEAPASGAVAALLGGPPAPTDALVTSFLEDIARGGSGAPPPPPPAMGGSKPAPALYFDVASGADGFLDIAIPAHDGRRKRWATPRRASRKHASTFQHPHLSSTTHVSRSSAAAPKRTRATCWAV